MKHRAIFASFVLSAAVALGQPNPLPDAPSATSRPPEATVSQPAPVFDRQYKIATVAMWTAAAGDAALTCDGLHNGGQEVMLPTQNCGAAVAWIAGSRAAANLGAYLLARHGHPRIAHVLMWGMTGGSVYGVTYTVVHWNDPLPNRVSPTAPIIVTHER